jgi:hypothetical protein
MLAKIQRDTTRHQYGQDHILQSYELYIPELEPSHLNMGAGGDRYWVLYIHGGYFRDPSVTSSSFLPALSLLVSSSSTKGNSRSHSHSHAGAASDVIAGYASINYRLSRHPKSPQDATETSAYELRNAQWPEPLDDVLSAIAHLQGKYHFGSRYLLVGHSVGATMAVLTTLASASANSNFTATRGLRSSPLALGIMPPMAVLGVAGIYDFEALHDSFPAYVELTRNAIPDPADDEFASPARHSRREYEGWTGITTRGKTGQKRALVLAYSRDDGLVDWKQVEAMRAVFGPETEGGRGRQGDGADGDGDGGITRGGISVHLIELHGAHNDLWARGSELARAIGQAVAIMRRLEDEHQDETG